MKKAFYASLCYQGARGGAIYVEDESIVYKNQTLTIPNEYKNLVMKVQDIERVEKCSAFIFPAVKIYFNNQRMYKFIIFNRKRFCECLRGNIWNT